MNQILTKARHTVGGKLLLTAGAVTGAVLLPQLVHLIGAVSGVGSALGELLLPMHFFVILAGFLAGPAVGFSVGACAPLISHLLSGMPSETVLPFMMIELIGYGLVAGLLSETKINGFLKLFVAQLGGRLLRAAAVLVAVYAFNLQTIGVVSIWNTVRVGLLGILLQWCLLPLLLSWLNRSETDRD